MGIFNLLLFTRVNTTLLKSMSVTQKDIAQLMGVDRSLVAHALRGNPRVSEKTRQRIVETAREMGYDQFSNGSARSMAAKRHGQRAQTGTLAVLMGDYFEGVALEDVPFFREILSGLKAGAGAMNTELSICLSPPDTLPRLVTKGGVDGAICVYRGDISALLRAHPLPIPTLRMGDAATGENAVLVDDRGGIGQTTRHLIELGHRHIAYIGDSCPKELPDVSYGERIGGYEDALHEAGLSVDPRLMVLDIGEPTARAGARGFDELQARGVPFSAVVCFNDQSALGVIRRANERGLRVPNDLSVTGFDGGSETFGPGLSLCTARFDRALMGRKAIELLCYAFDADQAEILTRIVPTQLRVGHSTKAFV